MHLIHTSIITFLPKHYHHRVMFLGAPLAYKLLVDRDCLTYGNTQYLADKIQSAKEYKDMCRTLCIQKIYTERISYLIF